MRAKLPGGLPAGVQPNFHPGFSPSDMRACTTQASGVGEPEELAGIEGYFTPSPKPPYVETTVTSQQPLDHPQPLHPSAYSPIPESPQSYTATTRLGNPSPVFQTYPQSHPHPDPQSFAAHGLWLTPPPTEVYDFSANRSPIASYSALNGSRTTSPQDWCSPGEQLLKPTMDPLGNIGDMANTSFNIETSFVGNITPAGNLDGEPVFFKQSPAMTPMTEETDGEEVMDKNKEERPPTPVHIDPEDLKKKCPHYVFLEPEADYWTDEERAAMKDMSYAKLLYHLFMRTKLPVIKLDDIYRWFERNTTKTDMTRSTKNAKNSNRVSRSGSSSRSDRAKRNLAKALQSSKYGEQLQEAINEAAAGAADEAVDDPFNPKGWQNSIRHNLSMNKAFVKPYNKKSSLWRITTEAKIHGVQSTTRDRKPPKSPKPASRRHANQSSGRGLSSAGPKKRNSRAKPNQNGNAARGTTRNESTTSCLQQTAGLSQQMPNASLTPMMRAPVQPNMNHLFASPSYQSSAGSSAVGPPTPPYFEADGLMYSAASGLPDLETGQGYSIPHMPLQHGTLNQAYSQQYMQQPAHYYQHQQPARHQFIPNHAQRHGQAIPPHQPAHAVPKYELCDIKGVYNESLNPMLPGNRLPGTLSGAHSIPAVYGELFASPEDFPDNEGPDRKPQFSDWVHVGKEDLGEYGYHKS